MRTLPVNVIVGRRVQLVPVKYAILTKAFNTGGRITLDILLQPTLFLSGRFSLQHWFSFGCTPVDILNFNLLLYDVPFI